MKKKRVYQGFSIGFLVLAVFFACGPHPAAGTQPQRAAFVPAEAEAPAEPVSEEAGGRAAPLTLPVQKLSLEGEPDRAVPEEAQPVSAPEPEAEAPPEVPKRGMVALTFDDGPHPEYTARILNALKETGGHATFFVVGQRVEKNAGLISRMVAEGNQVGNHSWSHKSFQKLNREGLAFQINATNDALMAYAGTKAYIVRPPYGAQSQKIRDRVGDPFILWSVDPQDWKNRNAEKIVQSVLSRVKSGDIVLLHDIYDTTASAAKEIIRRLTEQGYELVTVGELMERSGVAMQAGVSYSRAG